MPSAELAELLDLVRAGRAAMDGRVIGVEEHRARYRKLGALLSMPDGVTVEPVELGGVPAERLVPAGADDGVDVTVEVWPEMVHVWHFFAGRVPEADAAIAAIGRWLRPRLGLAG